MENMFRKDSLGFDGANYDSWKEKMKSHVSCMGLGYWLLMKTKKEIIEESKLEECSEGERYLLICKMRAKETLLSTLLKNEGSYTIHGSRILACDESYEGNC